MEIKRLIVPFELKALPDDASNIGEFVGYGSVFGSVDLGGDTIVRGAYQKSLDAWKSKGMLPQLLWYHDPEEIIGDWLEMSEDEYGLKVKGRLWIKGDLKLEDSIKAYNVLKGTSVKGLSIGYIAKDYEIQEQMNGSTIRILKEIELMEVSIAPWSMEPKAMVMGVKDAHGKIQSKRQVEKALRDLGLSHRQAKAFLAGGYEAMNRDDSGLDSVEDRDDSLDSDNLLASFKKLSTLLEGKL